MSLSSKIGGCVNNNRPSIGQVLRREQASYVYKKTESGEIINTETIQQKIEQERQLNEIDDTNGDIMELEFGVTPKILQEEYLDVYEGIQTEVVNTTGFDENSDLSMTYLGRSDRARSDKLKAEESFPISEQ